MKHKSAGKKGQFTIIAALLVAIVMISAVILTYASIRNLPFQESPQVLSSIEEMNLSLKQLLEFAVGYYGSILQVTGNVTYAKNLTSTYLQSGFAYIANSYPQWNPSFVIYNSSFSTLWYEPLSYSMGNLSLQYSLSGIGINKITYKTSSLLEVEILKTVAGQSEVLVTHEDGTPDLTLGIDNFFFYEYSNSSWQLINPTSNPIVYSNGTYILQIPSGVDQSSYLIKVSDVNGITTTAFFSNSGMPQYVYQFTWDSRYSSLTKDTITVEALQNGTLRWLGQNLQLSTNGKPIPPLPVKDFHVNETIGGINRQVPFQIEDWGSNYKVPLGLTSNASIFGNRQMIVFLVNHNVSQVTLWWNGQDTAKQTSYAWTNRYFKDKPANNFLSNGILNLTVGNFIITASVGSTTSSAQFFRINNQNPTYGSTPAYVIYNGTVRDIVQQEAEWSGGISTSSGATANCPNVYSQIYLTFPANATYYTYTGRLIFLNSSQSRTITDLSVIQLSVSSGSSSQLTENGTSGGYPISSNVAGQFYNFTSLSFQTGWAHHWSEFISGSSGAGIMFTNNSNTELYTFDNVAGHKTGALNVSSSSKTIEFDPVDPRSKYSASFTYPLDVSWYGAVVTFKNDPMNTIYPTSGNIGLWLMVEDPPKVVISTGNNVSVTVTSSPSGSGYVKVDGNAITTPATFIWAIGSNHTFAALSPVAGPAGTRYVWTGWSDGGAQNHTYTVPASYATISANYQTQYQVTFNYQVSGGGSNYSAPSVTYYQSGSKLFVTAGPNATVWADSGSTYTYTNPLSGSTSNARWQTNQASGTVSSQGTIKPTYYHQYLMTLSYSVSGGGSPTAPIFTANAFGASAPQTLTTTPTGYWFDSGSSWSITNPLSGSGSSERWQTNAATSGTISTSQTIAFTYYNQYSFTLSYAVSGGGSPTAPTLTATQFGSSYTPTLSTTGTQYWLDAGQSWSVTNPLSGSGSSQRWQTGQTTSGTVSSSSPTTAGGSLTFTYYNQYSFQLDYAVSGGGSPTAPTLTATQFGSSYSPTLTTSLVTYWLDSGKSWSVTNPLTGSGSSERWDSCQTVSGTVSSSSPTTAGGTLTFTYYNQYSITFNASTNVKSNSSATIVTVAGTGKTGAQLPYTNWYNSSSSLSYSYASPINSSSSPSNAKYLWSSTSGLSQILQSNTFTVSTNGTVTGTYTAQYKLTFAQSGLDSSATSTVVTVNGVAETYSNLPYTTAWINSGGSVTYSYNNTVTSSTTGKRFRLSSVSGPSSPITVTSPTTVTGNYVVQWQVTFDASSNVKSNSSATIVTVAGTGKTGAQLPYTNWYNSSSSLSYSYASPIGSSSSNTIGYYWSSTSGLSQTLQSNTFTVSASGTVTGTYTKQTFGIDANCEGFGSVASGTTITTSNMTAQANELIIVVITGNSNHPTVSNITDSFGTHLKYTQEIAYTSGSAGQCLYVYYALTGTQTGLFKITVKMSSSYNYCVQAFGITGANTATPFDTNPSLPAHARGTTSSYPTVTGVSTSNANDMILAFEGQTSSTAQTAGSPFTAPATLLHNVNSLGNNVEYEIVSSTQSGISVSFGTSVSPWIMAVHAVQRGW